MSDTTIKVGPYEVEQFVSDDDLVTDTNLNDTDLNDAFLNQSGLVAYYSTLLAKAAYQSGEFKLKRDVQIARVSKQYRENPPSDKKLTESAIAELVEDDKRVQSIKAAYLRACEVEAVMKGAVESLRHRKDMIVQLGAASREEAKGAVRMKMTSETSDRSSALKSRLKAK
ncbi:MAG: hypothetical protein NXH70_02455 [Hyphomonas sp.]|nr:hypothetical protein [Hyphomonas sp.]